METDYERIAIDETYDLVVHGKNPWPVNWTKVKKIKLLDRLIEYYSNCDEFEKCKNLLSKKEKTMK